MVEGHGKRRAAVLAALALALGAVGASTAYAAVSHPLRSVNPAGLRQGKDFARRQALRSSALGARPRTARPRTAVFAGLNLPGLTDPSGSPPDTTGAIGPGHYVEFVNSQVAVYDRNTLASVSQTDLPGFVGSSADVCDPQIQWDQQAGRWFYAALNCDAAPSPNQLFLGWSRTADPSDLTGAGWCKFTRSTGTLLYDYPKLGHDDQHLLVGANGFGTTDFVTAVILSVPKPAPGTTSCPGALPTPTVFGSSSSPLRTPDGDLVSTPVPANLADGSATGYVVAADDPTVAPFTRAQLTLWRVGGTATAPTLDAGRNVAVSPYTVPGNVPQPGTDGLIDSLDGRLTQAVAHADPSAGGAEAIWTQHTVNGPGGRSIVRWYELLGPDASLRQAGVLAPPGVFAFNGAISPTIGGSSAVIDFNTGSATALVQARAQSRNAGSPLSTMAGEVLLGQSQDVDADFSCLPPDVPCRWGDYAGASPDPIQSNVVWGSNQLNGPAPASAGDPNWITRNFAIQASVAPTAAFSVDTTGAVSGQPVSFTSSSADPDSAIAGQDWDFDGNGNFADASGQVVTHAFPRPGTYTVLLRVTDSEGASNVTSRTVTIGDRAPTASIAAATNAIVRRPVAFDASRSRDLDGTITRYEWDLDGNGSFETSTRTPRARHTYRRAVRVRPRLRVTDNAGNTATATISLQILSGRVAVRVVRSRLPSVLAHGLVVRVRSPVGGRARVTLAIARRTAQRLGIIAQSARGIVIGAASARVRAHRTRSVRVRVRRQARQRLRRVRSVRIIVRVSVPLAGTQIVFTSGSARLRR